MRAARRHARSSTASATRSSRRRMRDEGGAFGGEVSGHYYFADFYNADSGTLPALLILELLSKRGTTLAELLGRPPLALLHLRRDQLRGRRPAGEDGRDRGALRRRRDHASSTASRSTTTDWHFNVRPSNTEPLLRLNLESLVSHEDMERRRDEVLALIRGRERASTACAIPTPFRVGRVNCYLIDDDPLTLVDVGPNSGERARRARERAAASTAARSRTSSGSSSPTSTPTTSGWSACSPSARGAEVCALDVFAPVVEDFSGYAERNDELAQALMLRHGVPRDVVTALRAMSRAYRGWGGSAPVDARLARRRRARVRGPHASQVLHRPGHSPSDTVFFDAERRRAARRRPPDQAHLLQPADRAAARRPLRRARRAAPARAADVHGVAARDARDADRDRAARPRRAVRRPRGADRRALRDARAARAQDRSG